MISVAEALAHVTSSLRPLAAEQVALSDALGRVLAEDVASRLTQPPVDVSAMDGYAVHAADVANVPVTLKVIGESPAGGAFDDVLGAGQAVRTFTGAMVADGADAIVIQEVTDAEGDTVIIKESTEPGAYIRRAGQDFRTGQVLLAAGKLLTARDVGLAAAMNVPWLMVRRRPRIAILASGDEVVMPGEPLARNQIISSNSVALDAYVRALGGVPIILGIARDDEESLHAMLAGTEGADMLVTIGGASVGDHDLVRKVLGEEGLDLTFYKVAMRPGKPLIFGRLGNVPVLGMPGNPVSAGVSSVIFLGPAMEVMLGLRRPGEDAAEPAPTALLGRPLEANDRRQDYLRAKLARDNEGSPVATPFDKQDSAMMARLAAADCLVVRPPNAPPAEAGERVEIVPLATGLLSI